MRYVIAVRSQYPEAEDYGTVYMAEDIWEPGDAYLLEFVAKSKEEADIIYRKKLKSSDFSMAMELKLIPQPELTREDIDRVGPLLELVRCSATKQAGVQPDWGPLASAVFWSADYKRLAHQMAFDTDTEPVKQTFLRRSDEIAEEAMMLAKVRDKAKEYYEDQYSHLDYPTSLIYAAYMIGREDGYADS